MGISLAVKLYVGRNITVCRLQQESLWWLYLEHYYGHNYLHVTLGSVL